MHPTAESSSAGCITPRSQSADKTILKSEFLMVITLDSVSELLEDIAIFIQQIEGITIISEVIGRHCNIYSTNTRHHNN